MKAIYKHYRIPESEKGAVSFATWNKIKIQSADVRILPYSRKFKFGGSFADQKPLPFGGFCQCIIAEDNKILASGHAWCSFRDTYSYRTGRQIAYGRAMKMLETQGER